MPLNDFFSPSALAREIDQAESSVRFWLNRFSPWFPHTVDRGQKRYPRQSIDTLLLIAEKIDDGMVPSQIESFLEDTALAGKKAAEARNRRQKLDETVDKGLDMIQSLLGTMATLQEKIAAAQERRAGADEQKARALERRAAAEEQKAIAMQAIAAALGKMNQAIPENPAPEEAMFAAPPASSPDPQPVQPPDAHGTEQRLEQPADPHGTEPKTDDPDQEGQAPSPHSTEEADPDDMDIDDLSNLFKDEPVQDLDFKDLNLDDLSLLVDDTPEEPLDDLSLLVDDAPEEPLDDLSLLVDDAPEEPLDDLSLLVDDTPEEPLDDLSRLVDDTPEEPLDDLSLLVDDTPEEPLDDLSRLVDDAPKGSVAPDHGGLDNLGMLVEEETASIKPTITPDENFESYKSEIINIIIQLKRQGSSVEETTERFNSDGVLTLSGKPRWSPRAIEQIYRFIDAVKK